MEKVYSDFLEERKRIWLDKKVSSEAKKKKNITDEKIQAIRNRYQPEADQKYDYSTWFLKAVKEARPSITSHPSTFTHPDAKTTAILFKGSYIVDGYLRSGNVDISQQFDVFGNAATNAVVLDSFIFLTSKDENGQSIIDNFREQTKSSEQFIASFNLDYTDVFSKFNKMFLLPEKLVTNERVRQVYFPVSKTTDYHLLSVLPSSTLTFEQKSRIDEMKFSKRVEIARDNKKQKLYDENGFDELFNLTVLGYGGSHPENISVLAIQNRGLAYIFESTPPVLEKRHIRLPRYSFFKNSLWIKEYKESFQSLHKLIMANRNNIHIRQGIENIIRYIIDQVLFKALSIRALEPNWTLNEYYQALPLYQKIWLDNARADERETNEIWLEELTQALARWLFSSYETCLKQDAVSFGDGELLYVRGIIEDLIQQDKELLK